jgi:hypothetical protein
MNLKRTSHRVNRLDALAIILKFVAVFMAMGYKAGVNRAIPPLKSEVPRKSEVG